MLLTRYATRNLRRHRARTWLTASAVALAVGLVTIGDTLVSGLYNHIMTEFTRSTGHVRLRNPRYEKERRFNPLDFTVTGWRDREKAIVKVPGVTSVQARIELRVMVQRTDTSTIIPEDKLPPGTREEDLTDEQIFGRKTLEFAQGVGIEPSKVLARDQLARQVIAGRWLAGDDATEILIGVDLARRLAVKPGDKVELVSMRKGIVDAAATVAGIFDTGNRYANKMVYLPIATAERLLDLPDQATELLVFGKSHGASGRILAGLRASGLTGDLEVTEWKEIGIARVFLPVLQGVMGLLLIVIVIVAAVSLLNTMLMTVLERQREIGVLLALGMSRGQVVRAILVEALAFGVVGTLAGALIGLGGGLFLVHHGVELGADAAKNLVIAVGDRIYGEMSAMTVVRAALLGFVVALLGALWPAWRASAVQPVEAMRR